MSKIERERQKAIAAHRERQERDGGVTPRRAGLATERVRYAEERQEARQIAEAPWPRLRPAERVARWFNLAETPPPVDPNDRNEIEQARHQRLLAEIVGSRDVRDRWEIESYLRKVHYILTSGGRGVGSRLSGSVRPQWTIRDGRDRVITAWIYRKTQTLNAKATGKAPRRRGPRNVALAVAELLLAAGAKVTRCVDCGVWFARSTQKQQFHAPACASRWRKRQQRAARGEAAGRRRVKQQPVYRLPEHDWTTGIHASENSWHVRQETDNFLTQAEETPGGLTVWSRRRRRS